MQIKILFDKLTLDNRFLTGWAISFLIDDRILFDAGEKPSSLLKNMETMKVDIADIEAIVISHDHWDHTGGLWAILEKNPKLKVYACPDFGEDFKNKVKSYGNELIETDKFSSLSKNVYVTGQIKGKYAGSDMPEQALVLTTGKGLTILTGCAHPGIIKIIENVKQNLAGDIYLVLGGFHLTGYDKKAVSAIVNKFRQLKVRKAAPTHCAGDKAINMFEEEYGNDFVKVKTGQIKEV